MGAETLVATAVLGTGLGLYGSKRQKDVMHDEKRRQTKMMTAAEQAQRQREQQALQQRTMEAARAAQRRKQLAGGGFNSTIRSGSPLGIPGGGQKFGGQTLIGGN